MASPPSDSNPYSPPEAAPVDLGFRDMRTLLTVMGIVTILAGLSCACFGGAYGIFLPVMMANAPVDSPEMEQLRSQLGTTPGIMAGVGLMMAGMAAALIWLGIGTIKSRRWARDLNYSLGWLLGGMVVLSGLGYAVTLPSIMHSMNSTSGGSGGGSTAGMGIAMVIGTVIGFGFYLAPAVALIVIFGLKNVRLTVQHFDRSSPWTDRVAIPVQIWWILLVWSSFSVLAMAPTYGDFFTALGMAPSPLVAALGLTFAAVICAALAWGVGTRLPWSWAISIAFVFASLIWGFFATRNLDFIKAYDAMGIDEPQVAVMRSIYGENFSALLLPMAFSGAGCLAYLLVIRRYWNSRAPGNPV